MNLRETLIKLIEGELDKKEHVLLTERKSHFEVLKKNKVPLTDEERKKCLDTDTVWNFSHLNKPTPAVWKSVNPKTKKVTYVTNTHRAFNTAPTLKGAIARYHDFIKGTA
jgi:hypothetical protein